MNHSVLPQLHPEQVEVEIGRADELEVRSGLSSELDEMWSYVRRKANPRWLWHAIDHHTGTVLAYVFGRRQDTVFLELKALLEPFGIADKNFKGLFLPRHLVSAPAGSALGQGAERC